MEFIRIQDGVVVERSESVPEGSPYEWMELYVVKPDISNRQRYGNPQYDLSKNPPEFIYPVVEITESEKKTELLLKNRAKHKEFIFSELHKEFIINNSYQVDINILTNHINEYRIKKEEILNCKNYEELEAIII